MKYACVVALLLLASVAFAKDKRDEDYPIHVLVVQSQEGGFDYGCILDIIDADGNMQWRISSNGFCTTFKAGAKLNGRIHSKLGMRLFELAWHDQFSKIKTKSYRIDMERLAKP